MTFIGQEIIEIEFLPRSHDGPFFAERRKVYKTTSTFFGVWPKMCQHDFAVKIWFEEGLGQKLRPTTRSTFFVNWPKMCNYCFAVKNRFEDSLGQGHWGLRFFQCKYWSVASEVVLRPETTTSPVTGTFTPPKLISLLIN